MCELVFNPEKQLPWLVVNAFQWLHFLPNYRYKHTLNELPRRFLLSDIWLAYNLNNHLNAISSFSLQVSQWFLISDQEIELRICLQHIPTKFHRTSFSVFRIFLKLLRGAGNQDFSKAIWWIIVVLEF